MAPGRTHTEFAAEHAAVQAAEEEEAFSQTLQGYARRMYASEAAILQISLEVMNQYATVVPMMGVFTPQRSSDPTLLLNQVSDEGWELVNGSFTFVTKSERSRDKLLASGQQVAIEGVTVGFYLFKRNPAFRRSKTSEQEPSPAGSDTAGHATLNASTAASTEARSWFVR